MTEKRFYNDGKYVMQNGEVYIVCGGEHSADVVATALNELLDENEQLKLRNKQYSMMVNANSDLNDEIYEQLQKTEKALKRVCEENEQLKKQLNELNKYCTACDDTLTTIQELTHKLLTVDFKNTETKADYCHLLNELDNKDLSFIHDCIKAINKCDLECMTQLIREC